MAGINYKPQSTETMMQGITNHKKGIVFDIMKFAIHDGPGIRTTVFLKGCPLSCRWCHNPESQAAKPEISYIEGKCISCGKCIQACSENCHSILSEKHLFDRSACVRCGRCAGACSAQALEVIGKEVSVTEVITEVMKDKPFYDNTGGGVTFSGGEPMFQFAFLMGLLKAAKTCGMHVCVETCGYASIKCYADTLPYVDTYLFDIKETDPDKHLEYTGVPLEPIFESLKFLDLHNAKTVLRCPLIPDLNIREEHFYNIGSLASNLNSVVRVEVEPYIPLGIDKYKRIGRHDILYKNSLFPVDSDVEKWIESIKLYSSKRVIHS